MNIDGVGRCLHSEHRLCGYRYLHNEHRLCGYKYLHSEHRLFNYAYWRFCKEQCRNKQQQQQQQQQTFKGQQNQNTQNVKRSKVSRKADRRIGTQKRIKKSGTRKVVPSVFLSGLILTLSSYVLMYFICRGISVDCVGRY